MSNINTTKMLPPSSKGGPLVKSSKGGNVVAKEKFFATKKTVNVADIVGKKKQDYSDQVQEDVYEIKLKVIDIEKMLKSSFATQKKDVERKRKVSEKGEFEEREKKLEKKPDKEDLKKTSVPKQNLGLFGWIKNFIFNTILGFLAYRLIDQLPVAAKFLAVLMKAADFIIDIGGKLLNGLVTFIDWGYKAYDATRGFIKNLFGNTGVKLFDKFSSTLNTFINLAIIAGLVAARNGGGLPGQRGGRGGGRGGFSAPGSKGTRTRSGGGPQGRPDFRNPFRQGPNVTQGQGGKPGFRFPGTGPRVTGSGGGGGFNPFKGFKFPQLPKLPPGVGRALGGLGKSLGYIALVPAVFEVVGALQQGRQKDALRIIISAGLSMVVFNAILGLSGAAAVAETIFSGGLATPAAIATLLGGTALATGASVGTSMGTDALLKKLGLEDKKGYAKGGQAKSKRRSRRSKPSRKLKAVKGKRQISAKTPTIPQVSPGKDVGGEQKIFGVFPNPFAGLFGKKEEKPEEKPNPFGFMKRSSTTFSKIDFFGPVLTLASNLLLGQKPTGNDYQNVALGINALIQKGLSEKRLKGGIISAFAEGGLVSPDISNGDVDLTKWIEQSAKDAIYPKVDGVTRDLMKNMLLKKKEEESSTSAPPGNEIPGGATSGAGTADTSLNPYRRAFLDTLAYAEGTANYPNTGYNTMFTGKQFSGFKDHPRKIQRSSGYASDAAGRYQFLSTTWDGLGLADFSPANQDKGALKLLAPHVLTAIDKGDFATAFHGARKTWASLPGAGYGQPEKKMKTLVAYANGRLEKYRKGQIGKPVNDLSEGLSGAVGGDGKFIQGNSGASEGIHFHIGPGKNPGSRPDPAYRSDARGAAAKALAYFIGQGKSVYDGRRGVYYGKGNYGSQVAAAQKAHESTGGSTGGIDMQVGGADAGPTKLPFPLKVSSMAYRPGGFGVSAKIDGSNSFVAHGRYDEKGRVAPQEGGYRAYEKGGPTLSTPHTALIGEKGAEYVIDADSYAATEKVAPGLFDILNYNIHDKKSLQTNMPNIIASLSKYTSYESMGGTEVIVLDNAGSSQGGSEDSSAPAMGLNSNKGSSYDPFNKLYAVG